jgi:ABC-type bacteriocin/lantibiotic exporter with double-glycine peptidase domain
MTVLDRASIDIEPAAADGPATLPSTLLPYVMATSWMHQLPLLALTVTVFLLEVVPLELQRRIVNDTVKHRQYRAVVLLCTAYAVAVMVQGSVKLALNIYRAWVGERAKRNLRRCVCVAAEGGAQTAAARGTAVSLMVAEVDPIGNFVGSAVSEPLLQAGILAAVVVYIIHLDAWMGAAALALFVPQAIFVPVMQRAMNRRTGMGVRLLRQLGTGLIAADSQNTTIIAAEAPGIDRVFGINMRIFELKFTMNFLMNLCTHTQIIMALLLGSWRVLQGDLEIGGVVAFISGIGRLTDPWGDFVNYCRDLSVNSVKFKLIAAAVNGPGVTASSDRPPA